MRVCTTYPIFPRYIGPKPIYRRYIVDIIDFLPIFPSNDYRLSISYQTLLISDISADISDIFIPGGNRTSEIDCVARDPIELVQAI